MGRIQTCGLSFGAAIGIWLPLAFSETAWALEDARTLPAGVDRLSFRVVNAQISNQTDDRGVSLGLEDPIEQDLTFADILSSEKEALKRELTAGFLEYAGFSEELSVGRFTADLEGRINVYAPIYARGLTDRLTVAIALPVYDMAMNVAVGFQANTTAESFKASLTDPFNNQFQGAADTVEQLNGAVERLNTQLLENGYAPLQEWREVGVGDLQVVAKYALLQESPLRLALQGGVVAPTGRVDDPDNLIDAGFGDGQWDALLQMTADQPIPGTPVFFNQYAQYTYQFADTKEVRLKTSEESIEVPKARVRYKLGDRVNAGASVQYADDLGLTAGAGYNFQRKGHDDFAAGASSSELEKNTLQLVHEAELVFGYSAVPAFRRKEIGIPFEISLAYKRQLASRNFPVTHFLQIETGVFF